MGNVKPFENIIGFVSTIGLNIYVYCNNKEVAFITLEHKSHYKMKYYIAIVIQKHFIY